MAVSTVDLFLLKKLSLKLRVDFLARGHYRPETSVPDICVRKHPSRTFESRAFAFGRLVKILMNVRTQMFGTGMPETKVSGLNFRTQLFGRKCPGRKCPRQLFLVVFVWAHVRTQIFGRKSPGRKFSDASDPSPILQCLI